MPVPVTPSSPRNQHRSAQVPTMQEFQQLVAYVEAIHANQVKIAQALNGLMEALSPSEQEGEEE